MIQYNTARSILYSFINAESRLKISIEIPEECRGLRLDQALASLLPEYSRSQLQRWIRAGHVRVSGQLMKQRDSVRGGEQVEVNAPDEQESTDCEPQDLPIDLVFADEDLIVINKAAGMVTHPAAGNWDGTLRNALLFHYPELANLPRSGIVHRLDKATSGLMVVARSLRAHTSLVRQLQERQMGREYEAVVNGVMVAGGSVDEPIGRHPVDRKRMAIVSNGKPAVTHYRIVQKFDSHTHIRVKLETGRTHQIRVHMAYIKYPIVGDPVYGGRRKVPSGASEVLMSELRSFPRQALHAARLELIHPRHDELVSWQVPLPEDMQQLIGLLEESAHG